MNNLIPILRQVQQADRVQNTVHYLNPRYITEIWEEDVDPGSQDSPHRATVCIRMINDTDDACTVFHDYPGGAAGLVSELSKTQ